MHALCLLYTSLVRSYLNYALVVWQPYLKDIRALEAVQPDYHYRHCTPDLDRLKQIIKFTLIVL